MRPRMPLTRGMVYLFKYVPIIAVVHIIKSPIDHHFLTLFICCPQVDARMVLLVMKQLESVLCGPKRIRESKRGMAALSPQTSVTLAIALAKLHMPIPHELHLTLLQSISSNLGIDVRLLT